jgi:type I restriction enzyme S subunit
VSEVVERASPQLVDDLQMVRLGDYLNVIRGASPRPKGDPRYFGGDIPWISISDITREPGKYLSRTREFVTRAGAEKSRLLPAGTLILSNSGTVCVPKILRVDGCIHDGFVAFPDLPDSFDKNYLYWFFEYVRPSIIEANRQGITQVNLNTGIVREIRLPLTSIERQREIVAELEKQFSRLDEAVGNLQRVKANLKRYKASVLKAAVEGRLVETEATLARREGRAYETGEQLLQRILEERRAKWVEKRKYKDPIAPVTGELPELPEGWTWATMPQLGELNRGKSKHRPRDDQALYGGPYPFIQTGDVRRSDGSITQFTQTYSQFGLAQSRLWPSGTLCITIAANIAETGILKLEACFPDSVVGFIPQMGSPTVEYVECFIRTARDRLDRFASATAQKNINLEVLEAVAIPTPPLAEQARIVAEVDRLLSIIREVEAEVDANLKRALALRQATLAKAFAPPELIQDTTQ